MRILKEIKYNGDVCVIVKKDELSDDSKDYNTGNGNTGDCNTSNCNTGDRNTGYRNTGYRNTGYRNTGYRNTGDWNTGNCNTGNCNTGGRNTGDYNTGGWNTGDYNTGFFNTDEPPIKFFNKNTDLKRSEIDSDLFPSFLFFELTEWIFESNMTESEKEKYLTYKTTGGYLKVYGYQEGFKKAWNEASIEDKDKLFALPNFDADIFKEISGIDVFKD